MSFLILVPLFFVMLLSISPRVLMSRLSLWLCLFLSAAQAYLVVFSPRGFWGSSLGFFKFNLGIDSLTFVLLLSIAIVIFTTAVVARGFVNKENKRFNFYSLLLLSLAGMNGVVLSRDIISLYVFLEITAVTSFVLIAFNDNRDSFEGAFKYVIFSVVATALMLTSIGLILLLSHGTSFAAIGSALADQSRSGLLSLAIGILLCSLFIKGGLFPFHGWLADAYSSASSPVSVLLAGIVTKTVGVYSLLRIVIDVLGFSAPIKTTLMFTGIVSIVFGALMALAQSDLKRMLAYSSISQVGYIILGLGCGTPIAIAAAVFHLFNHSVFKSLLFVNSAALEDNTKSTDMKKMGELAKKMPFTNITSLIAGLSAVGLPPLSGFWSKLLIIVALWVSGHYAYAVVAILASVLTLGYMISMQRTVFWSQPENSTVNIKEAGVNFVMPEVILAGIIVLTGVFFPLIVNTFMLPVSSIW